MLRSVQRERERRSLLKSHFPEKWEGQRRNVQCLGVTCRVLFRTVFVSGGAKSFLCVRVAIPSEIFCIIFEAFKPKDKHYHHS
jgi:hypothetical protein